MCFFVELDINFSVKISSRLDKKKFVKNSRTPDSKIFRDRKFKSFCSRNRARWRYFDIRDKMGNSNTKESESGMPVPTPSGRSVPREESEKADFVIDNMPDKTVRRYNLWLMIYD